MELGKKGGSNKQSKQQPKKEPYTEVVYRIKASSGNIQKFPKLRVWNGSNEHFEMYPERIDGTGSSGRDSDRNPEVIDISLSSQYSPSQPDDTVYEGDRLFAAAKFGSSSSLCSSSPPRSSDDLFQVNMKTEFNLKRASLPSPKVNKDIKPASDKHKKVYVISRNSSSSSEEQENDSRHPASMSPVSDVTNESLMPIISPTQSPPIQVMERSSGYDPSRIPPSAFARSRSTMPLEWSVASNESLFSIHIGNASFARGNAAISDMHKSGELTKSRELPPPIPPQPPSPIAAIKTENHPKGPSVPVVEIEKHTKETEKSGAIQVADRTTENPVRTPPADHNNGTKSGAIPSKSSKKYKHLDGTRDKASPLPVRKKKSCCSCLSCSSCSCSWSCCSCPRPRCKWTSCSFRWSSCFSWPTCCFRWPNCSCCKCSWPSCNCCTSCSWGCCHCWRCTLKKCCCDSSSDLVDGDKSDGSKPKAGKASKDSAYCCCAKPVCCNCMKPVCCSSPKSSCCSCSKSFCCSCSNQFCCSCSNQFCCSCSKPTCCCSFRLSSCFSCCKWPCSYRCRRCC